MLMLQCLQGEWSLNVTSVRGLDHSVTHMFASLYKFSKHNIALMSQVIVCGPQRIALTVCMDTK